MSRIRVVQLVAGLAIGERNGGAEMFALRLAGALDPTRFDVSVCALWRYGGLSERFWAGELRERGILVYYGGPHRNMLKTDAIVGLTGVYPYVRAIQPDILNSHTEFADLVALALRRMTATGVLVRTGHNVLEWPFALHWKRNTELLYPLLCDVEVGVSRAVVELLDERPLARLLGKRGGYIPNAIHPPLIDARRSGRTAQQMREVLGVAPDAPLFGTVGRLSDQKGLPHLFAAMAQVRERLPTAQLVVAGNGERAEAYATLLREQRQDNYITLLGPRTDAIDIVAALDLFVSSSLWEGLPTVILEAMYVGTPVVATDVAGSRDLVRDGETGRLAPAANPTALAEAMVAHYSDRVVAMRMVAAARAQLEEWTIERVAAQYSALYEGLTRKD
jgi:glycosyltransferase involved in cell wall biosynthesis